LRPEGAKEDQPEDDARPRAIALAGGRIMTGQGRMVAAWNLEDGKPSWKHRISANIKAIQPLDDTHVGVSDDDTFHILSTLDGKESSAVQVKEAILPPLDAVMVSENRVLLRVRTDESPAGEKLEWYNTETGKQLRSAGPWKRVCLTPQMLRCSADV